jgi:hypothetical protein
MDSTSDVIPADTWTRLVLREHEHEGLARLMLGLRRLIGREPVLMEAIVGGVVAEGRRYIATPEGSRLAAELAQTDLIKRGVVLWQALGLDAVTARAPSVLPSAVLSEWVKLIERCDLETLLMSLEGK